MKSKMPPLSSRYDLAYEVAGTLYDHAESWDYESGGRMLGTEIAYLLYGILAGTAMEYPQHGLMHKTLKPLFRKSHAV